MNASLAATADATAEVLNDPARHALTGPHAQLAVGSGRALRYRPDISPFFARPANDDAAAWAELAAMLPPEEALLSALTYHLDPPPGWRNEVVIPGVQLTAEAVAPPSAVAPKARPLSTADVPAMLDLTERTRPGPFLPATIEFGTYLGIFEGEKLAAMAGERMAPPGWQEVSAVCTDPQYRGRGYGTALVQTVVAGIHARGERAFLHTSAENTNAIRLYESLGFVYRGPMIFTRLRPC